MVKIWGKIIKNNKIIKDQVTISNIETSYQDSLSKCMVVLCREFDIEKPYWLKANMDEFNKRSKTSFNQDNFIDEIAFDKLEIEELEIE